MTLINTTPRQQAIFSQLAAALERVPAPRARVVGINGVDTAGKTCFARALARFLEARSHHVCLIHLDDFHNPRALRYQEEDVRRSYVRHAFNLPLLERELLAPARRGVSVDKALTLVDLDSDTLTNRRCYTIRRETLVLLEGVLLFRPPVDAYLDVRVFLHVPFDTVLRRAAARDVPRYGPAYLARYRSKYIPIQRWYLATHRPHQRSDFVVDNSDYAAPRLLAAPTYKMGEL